MAQMLSADHLHPSFQSIINRICICHYREINYNHFKSSKEQIRMLHPQELYKLIPKKVEKWTSRDVKQWFTVHKIQISNQFSFQSQNFNGKKFLNVTPEYLLKTCGVTSNILIRKIIQWIGYDRQQFEEYVEQHPSQQSSEVALSIKQNHVQVKEYSSEKTQIGNIQSKVQQKSKENTPMQNLEQKHCQSIIPIEVQKWKKKKINTEQSFVLPKRLPSRQNSNRPSNKSQNCIPVGANFVKSSYQILQNIIQFRFEQKSQFLNNSGKIGRNTCNDIIIVGDSVSRKHAEIIKDEQQFYLKDLESKFGTFIRIGTKHRRKIQEGDILTFEDSEIEIISFKYNKLNNIFDLRIRKFVQGQEFMINFYGKKSLVIGRESKDISFIDPRIHFNHARISCQKGQLTITEQNGKCFRKLAKTEILKLQNEDDTIRLGLFEVKIKMINNHKVIPSISEFEYKY